MPTRLGDSNQRQTATKRIVLCCAYVGLSFLAAAWFGLLQRVQAAENILPDRHVSAAPAKIQPKLVESYGKLPLSFEANQGQVRGPVQFLSRGRGYALFLTGDEAVLELEKSSVVSGQSSAAGNTLSSVASGRLAEMSKDGQRTTDNGPWTTDSVLRMKLIGANASAAVTGAEELPGKSNYFIGNDPKKWRTNVPNYAMVRYQDVYPGVDLVYYGTQGGQLEYDFVVAPGADAHSIGLSFRGAGHIRVDKGTGDLVLALAGSELRFRKPVVYQPTSGSGLPADRRPINGRFVLTGRNQIGFQVAAYDRRAPLIIDPVLIYSTYLGGGQFNIGYRVAVDASGSAYVAGATNSSDFPTTAGVFKSPLNPGGCPLYHHTKSFTCPDAFVTKLDSAGTQLVYSTYLGGSAPDAATGISVDSSGNAYVTGATSSTDFPTTVGAFQTSVTAARSHAFATKLNATGSALIYSTYLGGSGTDVSSISALDSGGNLYVAGGTNSADFPTTPGAFQRAPAGTSCTHDGLPVPCVDGFIAKLNQGGTALTYSTFLGGSNHDAVLGLAVDSAGNAYATGGTISTDFPIANALQPSAGTATCGPSGNPRPCSHAFVTKLNPTGTALTYSTYLGGNGDDAGIGIAVDATGAAYVTGATTSNQFPTSAGSAQPSFGGGTCGNPSQPFNCPDAFVAKLNPSGSTLAYSTYLGGSSFDFGWGIAVDNAENAYVVGGTDSLDFPTTDPTQVLKGGSCSIPTFSEPDSPNLHVQGFSFICPNAFLTKIDPTGSTRPFSTYLGGGSGDVAFSVAVDASGGTYLAGSTLSPTFPTANALQPSMTGYADAFISKFGSASGVNLSASALTFAGQLVGTTSVSQPVTLSNTGTAALTITSITTTTDFGETDNCMGSVAASGSCTINVTFSPTATGPLTGMLTITDNSNGVAGSTQTVSLSGTGTAPGVSLSSASLTFPAQISGTTSAAQTVTLTNTGSASLTFTAIGITGPFAIATSGTTCSTSNPVTAGLTCTVAVSFAPTAVGSASGNLSFTDNASGSPQTVGLTGTGQDFTVAPPSGSSTSASVAPGQPATYTLSVGGQAGLSGTVSFTCTGAPAEANCTVSPNPATAGTNVTVTVTTTAASVSAPRSRPLPPVAPLSPGLRGLLMLALALAATAWAIGRRNQPGVSRWQSTMVLLASGLLLTLALAGCGGGGGSANVTHNPGTPAGTYTLTVTGSTGSGSSALSHSVPLTLTVS